MPNGGIDVTIFQAHSCRVASRSKARQQGIKISESKKGLLLQGKYFIKFYDKDIQPNSNEFDYSSAVLSQM